MAESDLTPTELTWPEFLAERRVDLRRVERAAAEQLQDLFERFGWSPQLAELEHLRMSLRSEKLLEQQPSQVVEDWLALLAGLPNSGLERRRRAQWSRVVLIDDFGVQCTTPVVIPPPQPLQGPYGFYLYATLAVIPGGAGAFVASRVADSFTDNAGIVTGLPAAILLLSLLAGQIYM